ncbi:MAG: hypothetical protein GX185_00235, partial [Tissierellia bacterium]|nr:hypothetical protein [Tissierellia bacterium]
NGKSLADLNREYGIAKSTIKVWVERYNDSGSFNVNDNRTEEDISSDKSYFIVFQNKTYFEEKSGGYLWAPQRSKSGKEIFHWSNMTMIKKGDIIFSLYQRQIVSVNIALDSYIEATRPKSFDKLELWEDEGWLVKVDYNELEVPISIDDNIEEILKLCPEKYSPFNRTGSGNQGYLYEISEKLGDYLMELVQEKNVGFEKCIV